MRDHENLRMSSFAKETPLGVAMVEATYDIGYDFFPNLYREEVKTTCRKTDIEFLMDNIRFYLVDDDFSSLQEFSGTQCPPCPDDGTTFLLRCLDNTLTDEMKALSNDCYLALDKGIVDGYMDTMRNLIDGLKPIGSYVLCSNVSIDVYHIDHSTNEVLATLIAADTVEDPDKLYPPVWGKICEGYDPESKNGRGQGFLYGKVFVPFSQTIGKEL